MKTMTQKLAALCALVSLCSWLACTMEPSEPAEPAEPRFSILIQGGAVFDGLGGPAVETDIGIRDDRIVALGKLDPIDAEHVIDATGLSVTPGFIDTHSHSDFTLLADGRAMSKIFQGVTTELLGESSSAAPVLEGNRDAIEAALQNYDLTLDWTTLGEYFTRLEHQGISLNVLSTVGSGSVRAGIIGDENRTATPEELARMEEAVDQAMRDGAVGLSSGLIYVPNRYASTEEIVRLASVASRYNGFYVTHLRDEADLLLEGLSEAIQIGREADLPVHVLHFKFSSVRSQNPDAASPFSEATAMVERARNDGATIHADVYPYLASQSTLNLRLPEWAVDGGNAELVKRLSDKTLRARIVQQVRHHFALGIPGGTPDTVVLARTPASEHQVLQGSSISAIAETLGIEPAEALVRVVEAAQGRASAVYFGIRDEDLTLALQKDWVSLGSDGSALNPEGVFLRSHPHPRSYGSFPRLIARYVRERDVLTLPAAIEMMTSRAASQLGIEDRGVLREGAFADIIIFDDEKIEDLATFESPHKLATGVHSVLVNGVTVLAEGEHTGKRPGRVLRRR